MSEFKRWLIERFKIERKRFDRTGVYAYTQRAMAYNSNKIEGSTLTPEQTASLFDNGTLPVNDDYYRAKDVEEMNGHFLMFNHMLDTLEEELTENLIKRMHYELKSGVFEDRANGYAIGDYFHITVDVEVIPLAVNLLPAVFVILVLPFAVVPAARVLIPANGSRLGLRLSLCLRFRLCCRLLLRLL